MAELTQLPAAAVDRHLAILGMSEAGKTYAAKGAVEQLLAAGRRVCIIDPTGVWYGLRLQPDGVTPSPYPVAIFGGDHGDVELPRGAGARVAELVAGGEFSCVIDVKRLTVGERTRFFADFAERLHQVNRRPLQLVVDEAHLFAPQGRVHDPISGRMLHAANNLVSGGRALGLRVMLLSQRPAKLHKDSLTQVQTLVAMMVISPQDRGAIADWIKDAADAAQGRAIVAELAALQRGHGWVWAPRLGLLDRVAFGPIATFDSSATPEGDADHRPATLQALDLALLQAALLEPEPPPATNASRSRSAPSEALAAAEKRGYERGLAEGLARAQRSWLQRLLEEHRTQANALLAQLDALGPSDATGDGSSPASPEAAPTNRPSPRAQAKPARPRSRSADGALSQGALSLLGAASLDPGQVRDRTELAILAGLHPAAGYTRAAFRRIDDLVAAGAELPQPEPPFRDAATLVDHFAAKLAGAAARILRHLYVMGPQPYETVCAGVELSPTAGYTRAGWKALRNHRLIEETPQGWRLCRAILDLKEMRK